MPTAAAAGVRPDLQCLRQDELELERRADIRGARECDGAAHQGNQAAADAQTQATAAIQSWHGGIRLSVRREEAVVEVLGDAHPGIANGDAQLHPVAMVGDHPGRQPDLARGRELHRIPEQIQQYLTETPGIAAQHRRYVGRQIEHGREALCARPRLDHGDRALEHGLQVEVDAVELQSPSVHPRQVENVVDDGEERLTRIVHGLDVAALLVAQRRVEQQAGHADDAVHRLADLVAHRREKQGLGLVGPPRRVTIRLQAQELFVQSLHPAAPGDAPGCRTHA